MDKLQSVFSKEFGKKLLLPDDPRAFFENRALGSVLASKSYNAKLEWIGGLAKKVFAPLPHSQDIYARMSWVYGFRGRDVRRPLACVGADKASQEKLLFFTACIVVVYYPRINEQRHYLEHESEVISLAVAQ